MIYLKGFGKKSIAIALILTLTVSSAIGYAGLKLPKRADVSEKYKWQLNEIYSNKEAFYKDVNHVKKDLLPKYGNFKQQLNTAASIKAYIEHDETTYRLVNKISVYAGLLSNLDQSSSAYAEMNSAAESLSSAYGTATSFAIPEMLTLSTSQIEAIKKDPSMAEFGPYFDSLLKQKAHTLNGSEEELLSLASEMAGTPSNIYDKVMYGDYIKPEIKDSKGKTIVLTTSTYSQISESKDRKLRKKAYEARSESYKKLNNTLSETYLGEMKKNIFFAKARKYNSALEASLDAEDVPKSIYDNLITSVNGNLKYLHRYFDLMKKYQKVDQLYLYDTYVPLVDNYTFEMSYDDANKVIQKALAPLGKTYLTDYANGINSGWIDVYEDNNKYTGAFSWGSYDTKPYISLNYDNSLDSLLTMAHEMGHSLNSYYSNKAQRALYAEYPIFTAEVASTMNEMIVMDYLIKNARSEKEKLYLINKQVDNIKGTVFQQVMYSEFEMTAHEMMEKGTPLSPDALNNLWEKTVKKYYGKSFTADPYLKYGWTRIPHFYMNFYVYKYATSMSAAYSLSKDLFNDTDGKVKEKYLNFLASGGKNSPVETLKMTGVDMTTSKPVDDILVYFNGLLTEMDQLLAKQAKGQLK